MSLNAVNHRRVLHRMPELDDELPDTTAYVRKGLERTSTRAQRRRSPCAPTWMRCP